MQLYRAVYSKIVYRVSLPKRNEAFKLSERRAMPPAADTNTCPLSSLLIHAAADRYKFFLEVLLSRRRRAILEGPFAVCTHCGGAYLVGCWGVVQPVGHLTVNEDGGGSNPPAPANFYLVTLAGL